MMNKDSISAYFNEVFSDLENSLSMFKEQSFNEIPFEGSWTAGQVAQHLKLANGNFAHVLNGEVTTPDRPMDAKVAVLKDIFLNFESKMQSPDFIRPQLTTYDREQMLSETKGIKENIAKEIVALDLSKLCLSFELPNMGHLTRLEAIYFVIFHTQRHVAQIKHIHQFLTPS